MQVVRAVNFFAMFAILALFSVALGAEVGEREEIAKLLVVPMLIIGICVSAYGMLRAYSL